MTAPSPTTAPAGSPDQQPRPPASPEEPGKGSDRATAEEIKLVPLDPKDFAAAVARHKGEVVLVDFWATYCAPCRKQFPHTVKLHRDYSAAGLATISVSCDDAEKEAEALQFLKRSEAHFENFVSTAGSDEETFVGLEIEGGALPHYKLYDRAGKLRYTFGSDPTAEKQFTSEDIDARVKELLAEK
jgi:thiol-disulfide isomerase/thioredoxin